MLGIKLGLHGCQLREIEQNYSRDGQRCKTEVLDLWLRNAKNSTWEAISEVLSLMEECVVADEIRSIAALPLPWVRILFALVSGHCHELFDFMTQIRAVEVYNV